MNVFKPLISLSEERLIHYLIFLETITIYRVRIKLLCLTVSDVVDFYKMLISNVLLELGGYP